MSLSGSSEFTVKGLISVIKRHLKILTFTQMFFSLFIYVHGYAKVSDYYFPEDFNLVI